jgi:HEAT repeat protein
MRGGIFTLLLVVTIVVAPISTAFAGDRLAELTKVLTTSSNDKTRLAAVVALSKLEDKRAMKPLVADPRGRGSGSRQARSQGRAAAAQELRER